MVQFLNGEEWPPYVTDADVYMQYPEGTPEDQKFAMGHPFYGLVPGLFMYATIWLREHNRVCTILKKEHPHWVDERLFQTGKLIITGKSDFLVTCIYQSFEHIILMCKLVAMGYMIFKPLFK